MNSFLHLCMPVMMLKMRVGSNFLRENSGCVGRPEPLAVVCAKLRIAFSSIMRSAEDSPLAP
eukprot:3383809-Pleurochrysis_carterae.AAC.1